MEHSTPKRKWIFFLLLAFCLLSVRWYIDSILPASLRSPCRSNVRTWIRRSPIVGNSNAMGRVFSFLEQIRLQPLVLILGGSGVDKELVVMLSKTVPAATTFHLRSVMRLPEPYWKRAFRRKGALMPRQKKVVSNLLMAVQSFSMRLAISHRLHKLNFYESYKKSLSD